MGYSRRGREVESELREAAVAMSRLKAPLDSPLLGRALPGTTMRRFGIVSRARGVHLWLEVDLIGSCDRDARRGSSSDHAEIPSTVGLLSSHAYAIDRVVGELQAHGAAVPLSGSADRRHAAKFRRAATRIAGLHVHALRAAAAAANLAARGGPVGMLQRGEPAEMLNSSDGTSRALLSPRLASSRLVSPGWRRLVSAGSAVACSVRYSSLRSSAPPPHRVPRRAAPPAVAGLSKSHPRLGRALYLSALACCINPRAFNGITSGSPDSTHPSFQSAELAFASPCLASPCPSAPRALLQLTSRAQPWALVNSSLPSSIRTFISGSPSSPFARSCFYLDEHHLEPIPVTTFLACSCLSCRHVAR
ncbi:hypothetical protein L1887_50562 [Cichorium endivia]|nr:hypothetical protein L1887_50562 [Cichorium endivia]